MSFKLCIKDSQGISKSHDPVTVDYAIVGGNLLFSLHPEEETLVKIRSSFQIEKKKKTKPKQGQVFWTYTNVVKILKKIIVFYNSSDLSLAPPSKWSNIFPKNVLFKHFVLQEDFR